ncbi:MAG: hypothetical protein ABI664_17880 [bacterium]
MKRALRRTCVTLALAVASTASAHAQGQSAATLAGIFSRLRAGESIVGFSTTTPLVARRLDGLELYFRNADALGMTLDQLTDVYTRRRADLPTVARWNRHVPQFESGFVDSLVALNTVAHGALQRALMEKLSRPSLDSLYKPIDDFGAEVLVRARTANQEKLRRFYIKYGPESPQLNLAEVGLNYLGQLFIPGFLPNSDGMPSPYELVATYRTTDLTAAQSDAGHVTGRVVTTAQVGVRMYGFSETCGKGGRFVELIDPCHSSAGAFFMGPRDAPLSKLWGSGQRAGLYVARGKYHLGYVFGADKRVVFGVDQQLVPYVF